MLKIKFTTLILIINLFLTIIVVKCNKLVNNYVNNNNDEDSGRMDKSGNVESSRRSIKKMCQPPVCNEIIENSDEGDDVTFDEYFIDHEVTEKEAKFVISQMVENFFTASVPAWCSSCSKEKMKYCLGEKMLHDHCCCDHHHSKEQLPWLPHTCYTGEKPCQPHLGSCILYTETRECCCERALAKYWKKKLTNKSSRLKMPLKIYLFLIIVIKLFL